MQVDLSRSRAFGAAVLAALMTTATAFADEPLPAPEGDVVLTVTGAIGRTNADGEARFDLDMLRALPATTYETSTIWTDGTHVFEGVLLGELLAAVAGGGEAVRATALNDYAITIPLGEGDEETALIAYHLNGEEMSVRNKGPLWVVYPYDSDPDFRTETVYAKSIWQLHRLEIRN